MVISLIMLNLASWPMAYRVCELFHGTKFFFVINITACGKSRAKRWLGPSVFVKVQPSSRLVQLDASRRLMFWQKGRPPLPEGWPEPCWRSLKLNEASGCVACRASQAASNTG